MRLLRRVAGVFMLVFGLMMGYLGAAITFAAAVHSDRTWMMIINIPLGLALVGAAGMWFYFGVRLLRKRPQVDA